MMEGRLSACGSIGSFLVITLVLLLPLSSPAQTNDAPTAGSPPAALTNALGSTNAATLSEALSASTNASGTVIAPAAGDALAPVSRPSPMTMFPLGSGPTKPDDDIADIRPPVFHLQGTSPWPWIILAVSTAIAVAALLLLLPRRHHQLSARTAYDLALEKLEQARALMQEEQPIPYAVLVSETVRDYLGQRFHSPSTRRTTDEFLRQMESDPGTPLANHRDLLRDFLQACDLVKFARYQPTLQELDQVQERAVRFVQATRPEPAATEVHA